LLPVTVNRWKWRSFKLYKCLRISSMLRIISHR